MFTPATPHVIRTFLLELCCCSPTLLLYVLDGFSGRYRDQWLRRYCSAVRLKMAYKTQSVGEPVALDIPK